MDVVQPKDNIIIKRGDHLLLHQLGKRPRVQILGTNIDLHNIIGRPFSSIYHIKMVEKSYIVEECNPDEMRSSLSIDFIESGIDNRNIQDNNNAQALSKDEIIGMKNNGLPSQDIVQQLVNNSKTFTCKTEFAQQKWLRKKSNKYTDYLQILKPNIRLLSEVLMCDKSSPHNFRLLALRKDTLSQIITSVNFQPEGKYIVYENSCEGLIIATLMNLIGPKGKLINVITPNYAFHKRKALSAMKFPESKQKCVVNVNLSTFVKYSKNENNVVEEHTNDDKIMMMNNPESETVIPKSEPIGQSEESLIAASEDQNLKRKIDIDGASECKRTSYQERENDEVRQLLEEKADGLIVVCRDNANAFVKDMLQFLAPSRCFVVYNQFQTPLVQLHYDLKQCPNAVNVKLVENWLRSYQVLPNRTHPEINMLGTGGYLLSGFTVTDCIK